MTRRDRAAVAWYAVTALNCGLALLIQLVLFDRHGQVARRLIGVVIGWPLAYFVYTQVLGAISGWYPYPFLDADEHGTGRVLLNAVVVTVLVIALALVFLAVDRLLAERADRRTPATSYQGVN